MKGTAPAPRKQQSRDSGAPIIFIHIVKTTGTTFHSILTWQYRSQPSYWVRPGDLHTKEFLEMAPDQRANFKLVRGHMNFGLHNHVAQGAKYITFLRSPVERLVSYYRYCQDEARRNWNTNGWWNEAMRDWSVDDFLATGKDVQFDNGQVRFVSSLGYEKRSVTSADLDRAIDHIDTNFAFAGITERFDESLVVAERKLGWTRPLMYRRQKVRRNRQSLSNRTLERLRDANYFDQRLYEYVTGNSRNPLAKTSPSKSDFAFLREETDSSR